MIRSLCDNIQKKKQINTVTSEEGRDHIEERNSEQ
jgi:hypothetical protein